MEIVGGWPPSTPTATGSPLVDSSDGVCAVFDGDYVREHITHRVCRQTVLGEKATRAALYVAMTRGRESNTAYLYERVAEASEYSNAARDVLHVPRRGSGRAAAQLFRQIIATDARAQTAHDLAAETGRERLPMRVAALLIDRRTHTVQTRRAAHRHWCSKAQAAVGRSHNRAPTNTYTSRLITASSCNAGPRNLAGRHATPGPRADLIVRPGLARVRSCREAHH